MEIYEANMFKVKELDNNDNIEYIIESQEHCDIWWKESDIGIAGNYLFYDYPNDISKLRFNEWDKFDGVERNPIYFNILEYSFDYGKTWSKL